MQKSGIDTIKYHTWPRIPMEKWQTHSYTQQTRGQRSLSSYHNAQKTDAHKGITNTRQKKYPQKRHRLGTAVKIFTGGLKPALQRQPHKLIVIVRDWWLVRQNMTVRVWELIRWNVIESGQITCHTKSEWMIWRTDYNLTIMFCLTSYLIHLQSRFVWPVLRSL